MKTNCCILTLLTLSACASDSEDFEFLTRSGGDTTTLVRSPGSFESAAPNLTPADKLQHFVGDADFEAIFAPPPSTVNAGLGTQFNHVSCASCHIRNGRGGSQLTPELPGSTMLVRVSLPGRNPQTGGVVSVPELGDQLQDHAIAGNTAEAYVQVSYTFVKGKYADGTEYTLRQPTYVIAIHGGDELPSAALTSPRVAPPVLGLGLLEAIPEATLLSLADPDDEDSDGISGKVNYAWDLLRQRRAVGRFGWKANTTDLLHQAAGAYAADMGISSPMHPDHEGEPSESFDISQKVLEQTAFYTQTLAVPLRASFSNSAKSGGRFFVEAGCASCHRTKLVTGDHSIAALAHQTIAPYTDLLLHDLGPKLADNRPDFDASGSEWRTAPLWGIGLAEDILGEGSYLHDGRAQTLEEAILWHGGEAEAAKEAFRNASRVTRQQLVEFLKAL